jgi:subtilase family serine protease
MRKSSRFLGALRNLFNRVDARHLPKRRFAPCATPPSRRLRLESLEQRSLLDAGPLSAVPICQPAPLAGPDLQGSASAVGLAPSQVRGAYGLSGITFGAVSGDGRGQTIAVVVAYDDPNALSDVNAFSTHYGLPTFNNGAGTPTFTQLSENGYPVNRTNTSDPNYVPTDSRGPLQTTGKSSDWELEQSLDIEWAHAAAPMANITVFEAATSLFTAAHQAANTGGVVAVSMSWSYDESYWFSSPQGEASADSYYFTTPSGHYGGNNGAGGGNLMGGITFLAAAGDNGAYQGAKGDILLFVLRAGGCSS